jgi:hypothetical protein
LRNDVPSPQVMMRETFSMTCSGICAHKLRGLAGKQPYRQSGKTPKSALLWRFGALAV